ncbi:hypothetical protein BD779DRAFT_1674303 [Infundibulicybe gibba]|nr:hypothetical protein BD779DRAFT_1674303 [Infundibulicybe gibba]
MESSLNAMGSSSILSWAVFFALSLGVFSLPTPNPTEVSAVLNGKAYINKGFVGFGLIPSNFRESTGDTLGGIGSAMTMKLGTWKASRGVYTGTFLAHPDRGFNVDGTVDYQARQHEIDFVFRPYTGAANLTFAAAQQTLQLKYKKTTLLVERNNVKTTGFEGLTIDPINQVLYALLQSATIQDGGDDKSTSRLVGEWVVPLPQNSKNNTLAASEVHFVSPGVFLALSRDGNGRGDDNDESKYKQADLFSIEGATDIHGTKFDEPTHPIAVAGVLDPSIKPATYVGFANLIDPVQLARFGLHNGDPNDPTLIDDKWESLVLAPVDDPAFPDDYFLFTAADNDFLSTNGVSLGVPFNAGLDVDNQFLVLRLTLPGIPKGSVQRAIGVL